MKLDCGCIVNKRNKTYKKMCLKHIKEESPEVTNWKGKQTRCPYTCMSCGNKTGWSWIEPKHNCNNPMFDKKGEFNDNYKE